jgi:peptidoglycan/xylan/chitin deacetylase (PgdA/CDA1 family)
VLFRSWDQLGEMVAGGLVTIGAHTHSHPDLVSLPDDLVRQELDTCIELFRKRLGYDVRHFAYPRGLWNERVEVLVKERFETAVIGTGRKAMPVAFDPYRIPRVPVRRSDGLLFFKLRTRGWLEPEERFYEWLHRISGR